MKSKIIIVKANRLILNMIYVFKLKVTDLTTMAISST